MTEKRLFVDDNFAIVDTVLAADVANSGTFTVAYPTGFVQGDFTNDLADSNGYVHVNNNNKWMQAASKVSFSYGASLVTVTNSSGETWSAGQRVIIYLPIRDGNLVETVQVRYDLADLANGDILTNANLGIDGTIEHFEAWVTKAATTGGKAATITPYIDGTTVTGGALALTSANMTPLGNVVAASAITAANRLYRKSQLRLVASSVTAFVEGTVTLMLRIRRTPNI